MATTIQNAMDYSTPLSRKDEFYVFSKYRETKDKKYRDIIVKANFRFVVQVVSHMQSTHKHLHFDDMVSEGVLGLMHAADTFDHTKGIKFITYAVYWIKYYVIKGGYDSTLVSVPSGKIKQIRKTLSTEGEIDVESSHGIRSAYNALQFPHSLTSIVKEGSTLTFEDVLVDEKQNVESDVTKSTMSPKLIQAIKSHLSPLKADIILSTYGLGKSKSESTLQELAKMHGMSHERVRQLRREANYELTQIEVIKELKEGMYT